MSIAAAPSDLDTDFSGALPGMRNPMNSGGPVSVTAYVHEHTLVRIES